MNLLAVKPIPLLEAGKTGPDQVGIIVPDLDSALEDYGADEEWRIWTYHPQNLSSLTFRGSDGAFSVRLALNGTTGPQLELIESLEGPSIYEEWISKNGHGLHHLGYWVSDLQATIQLMERSGYPLLQVGVGTGKDGTGGFAYFDTEASLGFIVEAIEPPGQRRPPERTWPDADATATAVS